MSLWADERVYYPLQVRPSLPANWLPPGTGPAALRTKPRLAQALIAATWKAGIPFRAVVADSFYGDNLGLAEAFEPAEVSHVLALKPTKARGLPSNALIRP